jgi:ABC-type antimicrobial peptide transport system permease subunit
MTKTPGFPGLLVISSERSKATVYVQELQQLRPAADAARGMDLYASDAARALVDEIEATADQAKAVVIALVVAFCAAAFVTLTLALYLRGRHKAAQVGMLRAMGADDRVLWTVTAFEAALMWLVGVLIGLALASAAGATACGVYHVTADEFRAAFATGWWAVSVGGFLTGSLVGCVLGNLLPPAGSATAPPPSLWG